MKLINTVTIFLFCITTARAQESHYNHIFFENSPMRGSFFYSEVEYSSPSWLMNVSKKLPVADSVFFTPGNSVLLKYVSNPGGSWQATLLYKSIRGQELLAPATKLVFRLFTQTDIVSSGLPEVTLNHKNSTGSFVPIKDFIDAPRKGEWIKVSIPLEEFELKVGMVPDSTSVVFRQGNADGNQYSVFIDQVELTGNEVPPIRTKPVLTSAKGYERHIDITWTPVRDSAVKYIAVYRSGNGSKYTPVGIQSRFISRYTDYTGTPGRKYFYKISLLDNDYKESNQSNSVQASTRLMNDEELLNMVQEAHFRYYWEGAEQNSGMALENIHGRRSMIASGASGFGLMALIAGAERGFITRDELVTRFLKITLFLEKAEKFHGAFPHFISGTTGKVIPYFGERDNGADLVETSFLAQGLLTAKQYFKSDVPREREIIDRIDAIWKGIEWKWFRKDTLNPFLIWHWSPNHEWALTHKLIGWNETLITYFMAIASPTHGVPASMYYSGWASQSEEAKQYRSGWGQTAEGSAYTNGNSYYGIPLKVGVSNGGPLFFIHYSFLGLDPHSFTDAYTNYFDNNRNIALINYRYCVENPEKHEGYGPEAWGLTASDGLWSYQADEPVPHQDHGKITPTGALASFPYTPAKSMTALKNYYRNYGHFAWGEYGFYDAFNLDENWRSEIFMGLNQAPIVVMIENYRSGLLWKLFMKNSDVRAALNKIAAEKP